jgi:hypothetical protein
VDTKRQRNFSVKYLHKTWRKSTKSTVSLLVVWILFPSLLFFPFSSLLAQTWRWSGPWMGAITQVKINEKVSLINDVHYTPGAFWANLHGVSYRLHPRISVASGYGYILTGSPVTEQLQRYEHRTWSQILGQFPLNNNWRIQGRFRYDGRFRRAIINNEFADGFDFSSRWRFQFAVRRRIWTTPKEQRLNVEYFTELLLRSGQNPPNALDQWRNFAMLGWQTKKVNTLLGWHTRSTYNSQQNWIHRHGLVLWVIASL